MVDGDGDGDDDGDGDANVDAMSYNDTLTSRV